MSATAHDIINSPAFKSLVTRRWRVSISLTLAMLVIYIGFLLVVAFDKDLLALKMGQYYTLAIPVGLGIILIAWVMTGIYVFWANNRYDNAVEALRRQVKHES
jgi:uncharacterized membrane protein (DUF485 family)